MAALWEEFSAVGSLSTQGTSSATELFHNEVDDHLFASAPITLVDGITTINTDGDDLWIVSYVVVNEALTSAQVQALQRHEKAIWYSFYAVRGPLVFRMRSKKTIHPEEKLWVRFFKAGGNTAENARVGLQMLEVRH